MNKPSILSVLPKSTTSPTLASVPVSSVVRAGPAPSIRYDVLSQRHPECDLKQYERLEDLYEGGWIIQAKSKTYLPRYTLEHPKRYQARCETASYQPYFGQIVDQFVADLFTQALTIYPPGDAESPDTPGEYPDEEYYTTLEKDVDGEGTELDTLAADVLTTALKHRRAYVMVDAADVDAEFSNRAEEDASGARRFYAYELSPKHVIDWKTDKRDCFEWIVLWCLRRDRESPTSTRDEVTEDFTVWDLEGETARWAKYSVTYKPADRPRAETMIPLVDEGTTSFDRIPILELKLPKGLWVGNKIGTQALEHWRRRSELIGAESMSCVAIPYAQLGSEMGAQGGALPSEAQQNPHRGYDPVAKFEKQGFLTLGKDDALGFAEPEGKAYEIIDKQLDGLRESMFSVNHQMAASIHASNTALGRSGLSKQKDQESTSKVLGAFGRIIRKFFVGVYETISVARGEDVKWTATGLDSYELGDRQTLLEEAISMDQVQIPSKLFRITQKTQMAEKLLQGLDPATMSEIKKEIQEGVEGEQEMRDLMQDAQKDAIKNPPAPAPVAGPKVPAVPGVKTPNVKAPTVPAAQPPKPGGKGDAGPTTDSVPLTRAVPTSGKVVAVKQETTYTCGAAALRAAILHLIGKDIPEKTLRKGLRTTSDVGTEPAMIETEARRWGLEAEFKLAIPISTVRETLARGGLVVAMIQDKSARPSSWDQGHYVVIEDITPEGVTMMDPARGEPSHVSMPLAEFLSRWHGYDEDEKASHISIVLFAKGNTNTSLS